MAQLGALISFQAGTPAVANDVNNNFNLIRTFINSANFGVDNINSTLSSRSGAPILTLEQVSEPFSPLYIINAQSKHAINIWQQASLDANQGVILINDTITQTTASTAALLMTLAAGSTNPAILIKHGVVETFKLTKDALSGFAGNASATVDLFASAVELSQERVKLPLRTAAQRNSVSQEGSVLYNTDTDQLNVRRSDAWVPVESPVGSIQMYAVASAPEGWLLCNGAEYLKTSYPKLNEVLSESDTYPYGQTNGSGGAGTTHFRVPNLVGVFPRGAQMGGVTTQIIGGETFNAQTRSTTQRDATALNGLSDSGHTHAVNTTNDNYRILTALSPGVPGNNHETTFDETPERPVKSWTSGENPPIQAKSASANLTSSDTETIPANISLAFIIKY
jgi:microcystin-dependent protein